MPLNNPLAVIDRSWLLTQLLTDDVVIALKATVALFQANAGTQAVASVGDPNLINDGNTANRARYDNVNASVEVDFGIPVIIQRYRHFGDVTNNGDGAFKIEYWSFATNAWVDWVTGIASRALASWSNFVTVSKVFTSKVRITFTTLDSAGATYIAEIEIIY